MLVDQAKITVEAGAGGNGCLSFRREKFIPFGGPDGGDGGRGGDVILVAKTDVRTLVDFSFQPLYRAHHGDHGRGKNQHGRDSQNIIVKVPVGTVVWGENGEILADLSQEGQEFLAAKGGRGGRGNSSFATATRQAPRLAEKGEPGEAKELRLELKLLADVGLVGFPNAGKSTLLSRVTAARPKIAAYPFTTLEPQLGVVKLSGERSFVIADIPGIIEGAHEGKGLGLQFLRHLERTRVLLHLVEVAEIGTLKDLEKGIRVIEKELAQYPEHLERLPRVLVLTKLDACPDRDKIERWMSSLRGKGRWVTAVSAVAGEGLNELMEMAWTKILELPVAPLAPVPKVEHQVYRPEARFTIRMDDGVYRVEGPEIHKWSSMTDFGTRGGIERYHNILRRMGVLTELKKRGIQDGDRVLCGEHELIWEDQPNWERKGPG